MGVEFLQWPPDFPSNLPTNLREAVVGQYRDKYPIISEQDDILLMAQECLADHSEPVIEMDGSAETDKDVLIALYNAADGPNWGHWDPARRAKRIVFNKWLSDLPIGEWEGVTTNEDGRVTRLSLEGVGLQGVLPRELGNLSDLEELWLGWNRRSGIHSLRIWKPFEFVVFGHHCK